MNSGHPMADLLDLLVEIAAAHPLQSTQENTCRNQQSTLDSEPQNKPSLQLKSKSGGLVKNSNP